MRPDRWLRKKWNNWIYQKYIKPDPFLYEAGCYVSTKGKYAYLSNMYDLGENQRIYLLLPRSVRFREGVIESEEK